MREFCKSVTEVVRVVVRSLKGYVRMPLPGREVRQVKSFLNVETVIFKVLILKIMDGWMGV